MNIMPPSFQKFHCNACDFRCSKQSNYNKHILTSKHINRTNPHFSEQKNANQSATHYTCKNCSKKYKARNSLWYHEQTCTTITTEPITEKVAPLQVDDHMQTSLILELVKQNQEFKQLLIEQNKTIIEVAKNSQINNNTINNTKLALNKLIGENLNLDNSNRISNIIETNITKVRTDHDIGVR